MSKASLPWTKNEFVLPSALVVAGGSTGTKFDKSGFEGSTTKPSTGVSSILYPLSSTKMV